MCPYYNRDYKKCIIFGIVPLEDTQRRYCEECVRPYTECPNYNRSKEINGGSVPPPYRYK